MDRVKRFKTVSYLVAIVIIAVVVWQIAVYVGHRGMVGVNIQAVPSDSTLKIDGQPSRLGRVYLKVGTHKLLASRQYFDDDIKTINTSDITKGEIIYMLPAPNSAQAKFYLLEHPDIQKQREAAGGVEAQRIQALLLKKYPVIAKLPHETLDFKVDYSLDPTQKLSLVITTYAIINGPSDYRQYLSQTKQFRQEALDFLKKNGVEANTYPISYIPDGPNL